MKEVTHGLMQQTAVAQDYDDGPVRIDPDPEGPELGMLAQYLDCQRETILKKTEGLTREQLAQKHLPSELTLAGLPHHLSLVEELAGGALRWSA